MARNSGHWKEFADATGIDAKYAEHQAQARQELDNAVVTPKGDGLVAAADIDMKNPAGDFQHPASMLGSAKGRGSVRPPEPEGQQGGTVRQWRSWARPWRDRSN